jgi:hypothetical protein
MMLKYNRVSVFQRSRYKQAGLTLIELGLAILVSIFVVFAGLKVYQSTSDANTANDLTRDMAQVIATTRDLYNGQTFGAAAKTALTDTLGKNGVFRGTSITFATPDATTRWGALTVLSGDDANSLVAVIKITSVPSSVCPKIVPKLVGSVQAIYVGGTAVFDATGYNVDGKLTGAAVALSNAALGGACAANANGSVDISLVFGR